MPLLKTSIDITNDFPRITREVNDMAKRAVNAAAAEGAAAANAVGAQRNFSVDVESVRGTADGWAASFVCRKPHAWFHEFGTLGERRRKLEQDPRTNRTRAPGTGIKPLGFLSAGRRVGRKAMKREIARGL